MSHLLSAGPSPAQFCLVVGDELTRDVEGDAVDRPGEFEWPLVSLAGWYAEVIAAAQPPGLDRPGRGSMGRA